MFGIYGGNTEFKQWDLNQKVTEPSLVAGDKVVFLNASGMTHPMMAYTFNGEVVVDVPNELLTMPVPVVMSVSGKPEITTSFNVAAQDKPDGYVCEDNTSWKSMMKRHINSKRLAYATIESMVLFNQTGIEWSADGECAFSAFPEVSAGKTYKVSFDGAEYDCNCVEVMDGVLALGKIDEASEMPFVIEIINGEGAGVVYFGTPFPSSLSITAETETVRTIDPKFLPGGGGGMPKIEVHVASIDEACDFTLTSEQVAAVKSAATSGMPLVFSVVDDGAGVKVNVFANVTCNPQADYYAAKGTYEGSTVSIEGVGDTMMGRWEFE